MHCRRVGLALAAAMLARGPGLSAQTPVSDIPFGPKPYHLLDWYPALKTPDPTPGPHPWLLFSHGTGTDKSGIALFSLGRMLDLLHHNGFSVFAANWGNYPNLYPGMRDDVVSAMQHVKQNAAAYDVATDQMMLWGSSAGATIDTWLTYGPNLQEYGTQPAVPHTTRPIALLNWGGITNFLLMDPTLPMPALGAPTLADLSEAFKQSISASYLLIHEERDFTPPVQSYYGAVSGPLPYTNPHDLGLMADLHAVLEASFPDVHAASMMLDNPLHPHFDMVKIEELCEWTRGLVGKTGPLNLGGEAGGKHGYPRLWATGPFQAGSTVQLTLEAASAKPTTLLVFIGPKRADKNLGGLVLIPEPAFIATWNTDANGKLALSVTLPASVAPGSRAYLQFLHLDPQAPQKIALSNALKIVST